MSDAPWQQTLAELGGFFTLATSPGPEALPWAQVLQPEPLGARLEAVRAALAGSTRLPVADIDRQVAVSAAQVGIASHLWSVALATVVLHRWLPDLSARNLYSAPGLRGPLPLGVVDPDAGYAVPSLAEAVARVGEILVRGSLAELEQAYAQVGRTPLKVLTSNTASSLVGGARVLALHRPQHAAATWELTRELLTSTDLARAGRVVDPGSLPAGVGGAMGSPEEAFLRSGCCVFYRLPGHGLCPDCVLAPAHPDRVTEAH